MAFTRTKGGLAEKWRFHQVPTVWVEGPTDILFYEPISDGIPCRFEPFHGRENAQALVTALKKDDYPYLVILDGDYSILGRSRAPHRRVIILPRYSFENLLWEPDAINRACLRHARCGDDKDLVKTIMESRVRMLKNELLDAIILDVAARRVGTAPDVLPDRIEPLLKSQTSTELDATRVAKLVTEAKKRVDPTHLAASTNDVNEFLRERCVSHIVSGHLIFGLLRRIFIQSANKERGAKSVTSDDALLHIFSDSVWRFCDVGDHKRLKRGFRSKLRQLLAAYPD